VLGAVPAERIAVGGDVDLPIDDIAWRTSASIAVLSPLTPSLTEVAPASVDGAPMTSEAAATAVDGRVLSLAGSPVREEATYGVTRHGLIDLGTSDHRRIAFEDPTTAVVYVG
jgi:hypothetical protein